MESPLTPEIVRELQEIAKLDHEEQKKILPEFLKKLTPEQIEYIKKQQGEQQGGCLFCSIVEGKIPVKKIYEDYEVLAFLDIHPANTGHVLVIPKKHVQFSTQLEDVRIFEVANNAAKVIYFKLVKDTNIFIANGNNAGQRLNHLVVHVIPRENDDRISFAWQGKEIDEKELDKLMMLLRFQPGVRKEIKVEDAEEMLYDDYRIP